MSNSSSRKDRNSVSVFEYIAVAVAFILIIVAAGLALYFKSVFDPVFLINSFVYVITLVFAYVLFIGCMLVKIDERKQKRIFEWLIILSFLSTFFAMVAGLCNGNITGRTTLILQIIANSLFGAYWLIFWLYQSKSYPQSDFGSVVSVLMIAYMAFYILFSVANLVIPIFFAVTSDGTLLPRTDYFTLTYFMVWYVVYIIYVFTRKCGIKVKATLSSYVVFPLILDVIAFVMNKSIFFRSVFYSINSLCFMLPLYLIYFNLHIEQGRRMLEQKEELTSARISLMVSQIQPHFIYNSLTAIIGLIDIDTELAKESIVSFSDYLRVNLNALKDAKLVPFEKELEHCKTYLGFELLRFDNIRVDYDIETTDFLLPALTIQPLLENAVKHGVSQTGVGGVVTLAVRDVGDHICITVSDNGVGYDIEAVRDGVHIGLENVQNRLNNLCGGSVTVKSRIGEGTDVTVIIPKKGV